MTTLKEALERIAAFTPSQFLTGQAMALECVALARQALAAPSKQPAANTDALDLDALMERACKISDPGTSSTIMFGRPSVCFTDEALARFVLVEHARMARSATPAPEPARSRTFREIDKAHHERMSAALAEGAIRCPERLKNGGSCPHHNLQCGWPKCNEVPHD